MDGRRLEPRPFDRMIGFRAFEVDNGLSGGASRDGRIRVTAAYRNRPGRLEQTLAHEYLHLVQFQRGLQDRVHERLYPEDGDPTLDTALADSAILEGHGQYVADTYWRRYQGEGVSPSERLAARYENETAMFRRVTARYLWGARYLKARGAVDNFSALYSDLPRTTEEVLHPGTDDRPVPLNVTADPGSWLKVADGGRERAGELYLRLALRTEIDRERAIAAAAGWGNDRALRFTDADGEGTAFAWVVRFDDAANATEFVGPAREYARERSGRSDSVEARLKRVDDRTVTLLYGPAEFVEGATVRSDSGNVTVAAPKEAS
jgi:hypothetical protein